MNKTITIFGREPVVWVGLIEAALVLALSFFHFMTTQQLSLVMAVVTALSGCYVAYATHETMLGFIVGLAKSCVALGVGFGLAITDTQSAAVLSFVYLAAAFFNRTQTSPIVLAPPLPQTFPVPAAGTSYNDTQNANPVEVTTSLPDQPLNTAGVPAVPAAAPLTPAAEPTTP
jgi:hypothetical protein